jgi:hypothetical protein
MTASAARGDRFAGSTTTRSGIVRPVRAARFSYTVTVEHRAPAMSTPAHGADDNALSAWPLQLDTDHAATRTTSRVDRLIGLTQGS